MLSYLASKQSQTLFGQGLYNDERRAGMENQTSGSTEVSASVCECAARDTIRTTLTLGQIENKSRQISARGSD
jgi:hypothetical protein